MQISKFPLWICALMLCGVPALRAADTSAQAAARQALEQKMNQLDANPGEMPSASAPAAKAVAPVAPAAAATATAVEVTPAGAAPVVVTPAPAATVTAPTSEPGDNVVMTPVNNQQAKAAKAKAKADRAAAKLKARQDAEQAAAELKAKKETEKQAAKQKQAEAKLAAAKARTPDSGFAPMPAPASPIPLSNVEKLCLLLSRYKADQSTPEYYHTQRAAILAGP